MMKRMMLAGASALALVAFGGAASAATMLVGATFDKKTGQTIPGAIQIDDGNDCSGFFGKATANPDTWCDVGNGLNPATSVSPWIAKFDTNSTGGTWSTNGYFDTVDGSEWDLKGANGSTTSGMWEYTLGMGDPAIRFWSAKAGDAFNLFWTVASDSSNCQAGLLASNYTLACLNEAIQVTMGSYFTPGGKGLSHITFYDSEPMTPIPLPAAGWLLLAGVGGLAAMRRKKKAA